MEHANRETSYCMFVQFLFRKEEEDEAQASGAAMFEATRS